MTGGKLTGEGTFKGAVDNRGGTVAPAGGAIGRLEIDGDYTQAAHGRLDLGVKSAKSFDLLAVTGQSMLTGRATVTDDKDFEPAFGSGHQVLISASAGGSLSCVATTGGGTKAANGRKAGHWSAAVTASGLRLTWSRGAHRHC